MIVQCAHCKTRFELDADRVPRKKIRVRCSSCSGVFAIDGREAVATAPSAAAAAPVASPAPAASAPAAAPTTYGDITLDAPAVASAPPAPEPAPAPEPPVAAPEPVAPEPVAPEPVAAAPDPSGALDFEIERSSAPPVQPAAPSLGGETGASAAPTATAPTRSAAATVDPADDKSRRLARALVSDILVYNRDLRDKALADGNLVQALGVEIKKSWELYKERVTPEVANSNNHFREALNEILANGQKIF